MAFFFVAMSCHVVTFRQIKSQIWKICHFVICIPYYHKYISSNKTLRKAKVSFDPVPVPCSWCLGLGILSNSQKYPEPLSQYSQVIPKISKVLEIKKLQHLQQILRGWERKVKVLFVIIFWVDNNDRTF